MIKQIGRYRIEGVLGSGAMGVVYKGRHDVLGREAAIKAVRHADDERLRDRLLAEARAQSHLHHDNIVAVYEEIPGDDGAHFLAMEYVDGETLSTMLERSPGSLLTPDVARPIWTQLLAALHYVHTREIVHRDLKPSNVLISRTGQVKLTDFGIALFAGEARLTTHGVPGTPAYMSPEQLEGRRDVDGRSDIYSAALVFYRALAGRTAFDAKDYFPMVQDRMAGPRPIAAIAPHLPPGLCEALAKATQYDREHRYRSAADFCEALCDGAAGYVGPVRRAMDDAPTLVQPNDDQVEVVAAPPEDGPWRMPAVAACAAVALLAGGASVLFVEPREDDTPFVTASIVPEPVVPVPPIEKTEPSPATTPQPKPEPPLPATTTNPTTTTASAPAVDEERERERERERDAEIERIRRRTIDALRLQLEERFRTVRQQLDGEDFDEARAELKNMLTMAQLYPGDLWQELEAIEALRAEEPWLRRLADVERKLREEAWIEAEYLAKGIAADRDAPTAVAERAREIQQEMKELRGNGFRAMQTGPTTNTIVRKPSSPPRKDL